MWRLWNMSEQHTHKYHLLYAQPRIKEGILIARCDCGATEERSVKDVEEQMHKEHAVYLFDFNNTPPEEIENE